MPLLVLNTNALVFLTCLNASPFLHATGLAQLGWTGLDVDAQDLNGFLWLDWIGLDEDALTLLCLVKNGCTE